MELRVWKTLLLQWVLKCNFIEKILCLEESDIEAFFDIIKSAVVKLADKHSVAPSNIAPFSGTLQNFLNEYYPHFAPQLEDDGRVAHDDYIYVYSLLLHFTCIQTPLPHFQNSCNQLPKTMQQCIVVFFEQIVNIPLLTRNCLHQTILNIREDTENQKSLVPAVDSHCADSTPIDNDAIVCTNPETPPPAQKTLRNLRDASQMTTPPTPKSEMLEQCTRELLGLKAKLQTVEYENTYLEEQITEDKQVIKSLSEKNKQLIKLKTVQIKENEEENHAYTSVSNEVDNLKRHMHKELSIKDAIIAKHDEQMLELKAEYDKISAKLKTSEKELYKYYNKTNELELHSDSISQMLAIKDEAIACLQRDKLELEQCLKETRDELHKGREVLNASSDLLDTSLSPGSMNITPENLACSVIDKQLREKEQENETLREKLTTIKAASARFQEGLLKIHQLDVPPTPYDDDTCVLNIIEHSRGQMLYRLELVQQRTNELQDQFNKQNLLCKQYEEDIQQLRNEADKLVEELEDCRSKLRKSNEMLDFREHEIKGKNLRITELSHQSTELASTQRALGEHIQHQDRKLAEQQKKFTDAQKQLKCFFDRISAQLSKNGSILSNGEISFKDVENILVQTSNQLEDSKTKLSAKSKMSSSQNEITLKSLRTLNAYTGQPNDQIYIECESRNPYILYIKVIQFVSKYDQLKSKFDLLQSDHVQSAAKMKQLHNELEETNIKHESTSKELQMQLQQKSKECERITQEWQIEKLTIENETVIQMQEMKLELEATQQKLTERESFLKDLQAQYTELQQELHKKSEEGKKVCQELEVEIKRKSTNQNAIAAELEKLQLEKEAKQQELGKLQSLLKDLQAQFNELKAEVPQKTEECNRLTQELQKEKAIKIILGNELEEMGLAQKNMQQEVKEMGSLLEEVQNQNKEMKQKLQQKTYKCEELTEELQAEQNYNKSIQTDLGKEQRDSQQNKLLLKDLQTQCNELEQQLQKKSEECKALTQKLEMEKKCKAYIENSLSEELQKMKLEEKAKMHELTEVQKQCDELKEQLLQKSKECAKITQELQVKTTTIQNDLGKEKAKEEELKEQLTLLQDVQKQCKDLKQQLQHKTEECEKLTDVMQAEQECKASIQNHLRMEQQQKESILKDLQIQCNQLQQQLQEKSEECESLTEEVQVEQKCKASIQNGLSKQLQKLKLEEKARQQELGEAQKQCDELKLQLEQKSEECKRISQEMQVKHESIKASIQNELGKELHRLELELENVKQEESQKRKSHELCIQKLQDALKEERLKSLQLEQEQCQQLANKCTVEKELNGVKDSLAQRELEMEKSKAQLDSQNKRLERTVIKLGEQQAIVSKMQREIAQMKFAHEEQGKLVNALQNEKEGLQLELRKSKERANRAEEKLSSLEQQCKKITSLEHQHERKVRLEKVRDNADKKIFMVSEEENARLRLEIGALNSDIAQQQKKGADLKNQLQLANDTIAKLMRDQESNEELQCDLTAKLKQALADYESIKERETLYHRKLKAIKEELESSLADNIEMRNSHETHLEAMHRENRIVFEQMKSKEHQMELDCQILQAKYRDSKEEIGRFEQKLKDQRLEMEGKLEKMKSKMRALYKAEVVRMKEKQERDAASNRVELDKLTAQNNKYDEHTRALSAQIVRLNEKILEQQKQHAIVSTKLLHLQEAEKAVAASSPVEAWQPFKRPSAPSSNLGSNLAMEDEEGEVFNNTYLTDLKLGRMPDMTSEELQYRNSLQPPHLKSTYAAQYDLGSQESDLKDGPHSLDDSMSALLSTTGGNGNGTRKKSMGTHYKRPGPPTPSKNGGRLSFGSSEPPREILRETYDNGCAKTPARFKIFASRFSMGSSGTTTTTAAHSLSRDENSPPKRRLSNMFKRK